MGQLLRRAVVPELLEDRISPAFGGGSFLDGVAVAVFAVGGQRVAHVQVGVGHAVGAEDLDAIVHAAAARPTVFDQCHRAVGELHDAQRIVFGLSLVAVNVGAHLAIDRLDGGAIEEPVAEGDAVAAEVHEGAAAGAIHVPEPLAVRAEMLFALLDEIDFAEGAGVGHFFRLQVFRREDKLLAVHQQNAVAFGDGDHLLALRDGHGQGLFADDVFAGRGAVFGHLRVQAVRRGDGHHLDVFFFEHLAVVGEHARNVEFPGECGGVAGSGGSDGDDLGLVRHDLERCGVNVRLKLRSDDSDFDSAVGHAPLRSLCSGLRVRASPRPQRLDSDITKPDFGTLRFQQNPSALQRDHPRRIGRVGPLDVTARFTIRPFTRCVV